MYFSPTYFEATCHLTRNFASRVTSCTPALLGQTKIPKYFLITQIEFFYSGIDKNNKPPPSGGGIDSVGGFPAISKSIFTYAPITTFTSCGGDT